MKRSDFALNFGTPPDSPRTSSEFEEVGYPHSNPDSNSPDHSYSWTSVPRREEELPLHYMSEDVARRRVVRPQGVSGPNEPSEKREGEYLDYDDGGKDVYSKMRTARGPTGSGRIHRAHVPPPTTIVRSTSLPSFSHVLRQNFSGRIYPTKSRTYTTSHLHTPFLLDSLLPDWQGRHCRVG